jgi:hypothetical protein
VNAPIGDEWHVKPVYESDWFEKKFPGGGTVYYKPHKDEKDNDENKELLMETIEGGPYLGYEYKVQYLFNGEWHNCWSNSYGRDDWYPTLSNAKNALTQMKNGYRTYEYRIVRRPYGAVEVVES